MCAAVCCAAVCCCVVDGCPSVCLSVTHHRQSVGRMYVSLTYTTVQHIITVAVRSAHAVSASTDCLLIVCRGEPRQTGTESMKNDDGGGKANSSLYTE